MPVASKLHPAYGHSRYIYKKIYKPPQTVVEISTTIRDYKEARHHKDLDYV